MRVVISTGVSGGGRDHGHESEILTPVDVCGRGTGSWGTWMPGNGLHTRMGSLCQDPVCAALDGSQEAGSEVNTKGHIHTHVRTCAHTHTHTRTHSGLQRFLPVRSEGMQLTARPQTDRQTSLG